MHPVAMLTDFGTRDWYVASMKGVLLSKAPGCACIDITHQVPPGNIRHASFILEQCYREFPESTVFLGVVDPGVGTERKAIAISAQNRFFVGPDNGLFTFLAQDTNAQIREITHPECLSANASNTFHGRDLFSPTAAYLSAGKPFEALGNALDTLQSIPTIQPEFKAQKMLAEVRFIDHYGNLITNIRAEDIHEHYSHPPILVYKKMPLPLTKTFGDVPAGELTAYFGSGGYLEIALNGGNAADKLNLLPGSRLKLKIPKEHKAD